MQNKWLCNPASNQSVTFWRIFWIRMATKIMIYIKSGPSPPDKKNINHICLPTDYYFFYFNSDTTRLLRRNSPIVASGQTDTDTHPSVDVEFLP